MNKKTFFYRYGTWLLLIGLMLVYGYVFSYYSIQRHDAFASGYDLANADQTIWNTIHGHIFQLSSKGKLLSRMTIHADIILLLIAPLYALWDNIRFVLIIQSVALALGAIPVYLLAQRLLRHTPAAFLCVLMYLLNPSMQWANMYDFHGIVLAIPLLLFAFYFAYRGKWLWYIVFAFFAVLTKEEVSLLVFMMGAYLIFFRQERKIGIMTMAAGMIWFLGVVFFVMPYFRGGSQHWAFAWYQFAEPEGETETQKAFLFREIFNRLFLAADVMPYYLALLKPFAFILPIIGLPVLILAAPEVLINTLSTHAEMRGTMLHYQSGIIPFLVLAAIFGIQQLFSFIRTSPFFSPHASFLHYSLIAVILVFVARVNYRNTPLPYNPSCDCRIYAVSEDEIAFERMLQSIPQQASVTSSPEVRPHVTHRVESFTLPRKADSADYVALIDQNRLVGDYSAKSYELRLRDTLLGSPAYELVNHQGHFYLFRKR